MQSHARVVVVGGGAVGVNVLYSLARRGWNDTCLLERTELTAGSTWHAAGLIPVYSFSYSIGRLIKKTIEIYDNLEAETGQGIGWHKCGQLRIAESPDRMDEYLNYAAIAETQGVRAEILIVDSSSDDTASKAVAAGARVSRAQAGAPREAGPRHRRRRHIAGACAAAPAGSSPP